jgi:hypothetical protein
MKEYLYLDRTIVLLLPIDHIHLPFVAGDRFTIVGLRDDSQGHGFAARCETRPPRSPDELWRFDWTALGELWDFA